MLDLGLESLVIHRKSLLKSMIFTAFVYTQKDIQKDHQKGMTRLHKRPTILVAE